MEESAGFIVCLEDAESVEQPPGIEEQHEASDHVQPGNESAIGRRTGSDRAFGKLIRRRLWCWFLVIIVSVFLSHDLLVDRLESVAHFGENGEFGENSEDRRQDPACPGQGCPSVPPSGRSQYIGCPAFSLFFDIARTCRGSTSLGHLQGLCPNHQTPSGNYDASRTWISRPRPTTFGVSEA